MLWKKKKEEIKSGVDWSNDGEGLHIVHIRGVLEDDMLKELQDYAAREIDQMGSIRGLMILEHFQGWPKHGKSENLDFLLKYDASIEKMALVGDLKWKEEMLVFMGVGYRQAQVQYFSTEDEAKAREWLKA